MTRVGWLAGPETTESPSSNTSGMGSTMTSRSSTPPTTPVSKHSRRSTGSCARSPAESEPSESSSRLETLLARIEGWVLTGVTAASVTHQHILSLLDSITRVENSRYAARGALAVFRDDEALNSAASELRDCGGGPIWHRIEQLRQVDVRAVALGLQSTGTLWQTRSPNSSPKAVTRRSQSPGPLR